MRTANIERAITLQQQLRTRLLETGLQVQGMRFEVEARDTIDEISSVIGLAALAALEDEKSVFSSLAAAAPHMVSLLEQEQERNSMLAEKLSCAVEAYEDGFSAEERAAALKLVRFAFHEWMAQVLNYLNKQDLVMQDRVVVKEEAVTMYAVRA